MPTAVVGRGAKVEAGGEHRAGDGRLISRQLTVPLPKMPDPPAMPDPNCRECINQYIGDFDKWTKQCKELHKGHEKIMEYHAKRVAFAEKYRSVEIPEKYRTGIPSPTTGQEAKDGMKTLKNLEKEVKRVTGRSCKQ